MSDRDWSSDVCSSDLVTLEDGSQITLAPNSAMNVSFEKGRRFVELVKGKALFDVFENKQRPFVVHTDQLNVTVLGTSFEVQSAYASEASSVAVRHGKVRVEGTGKAGIASGVQILRSGDWVSRAPDGQATLGTRKVDQIAMWQNNMLLAQNTSLKEVIAELDHYFTGKIVVAGEAFGREPVTGVYQLNDTEAALSAISASHGAEIYRVSPWLIVVLEG